jgi:hypothetical protein
MNSIFTPKTRIQKYARYRRFITKPQAIYSRLPVSKTKEDQPSQSLPLQILVYSLVGGVIILLILVVALIYFGR